jgi:putative peptidoglycan lipid II flippase
VSTFRAASLVALCTLVSRVLGLVRDTMMTHVFGASWVMGMFALAWMIPNLLRRLFGEGALSASFVPAFAAALDRRGLPAARALLSTVTGGLLLGLGVLVLLVVATAFAMPPSWLHLSAVAEAEPDQRGRLFLHLTAILFPYVVPICLTAVYGGALNAMGSFLAAAVSPVVLNVFWMAGIVAAGAGGGGPDQLAATVAWFLFAGGSAQLALVAAALARRGCLPPPALPRAGDPARAVFRGMAPTLLGLSVVQLNLLFDQGMAEYLVGPGANTHVYLANRLLLFPHALTALAVATAVFPTLALLASRDARDEMARKLDQAVRWTAFLSVPASVGLALISADFVELAFVHGSYTEADARLTSATTVCLVAGLPFLSASQLYARALYALGDTRTPAAVSVVLLAANAGLNLMFTLGLGLGVAGLTLATSLCALANCLLLRWRLAGLLPRTGGGAPALARIGLASLGMAAAVLAAQRAFAGEGVIGRTALDLLAPTGVGVAVYLLLHVTLGGQETIHLLRRLLRRQSMRSNSR